MQYDNSRYFDEDELREELLRILVIIKSKITDESDVVYSGYESPEEIRTVIETHIFNIKQGGTTGIEQIEVLFLPAGAFQELSMANGWSREYLQTAKQFDTVCRKIKVFRNLNYNL